jgi:hypothetical protein
LCKFSKLPLFALIKIKIPLNPYITKFYYFYPILIYHLVWHTFLLFSIIFCIQRIDFRTNVVGTSVVGTNVVGTNVVGTNVVGTNVVGTKVGTNVVRTNVATNVIRTNVV